jgi:hypothetical protein
MSHSDLRRLLTLFLTFGVLLFYVTPVLAVPPLPSSFFGKVKSNGANVPAGVQVTAWINGVRYATSAYIIDNGDTVFSLNVPGDDTDTPGVIEGGVPGDTIIFFIGRNQADQTALWQSGKNVNLDLTTPLPISLQIYLPLVKH